MGLRLGWGIRPRLGLHMSGDIGAMEGDVGVGSALTHVELVGRWSFVGERRRWSPYLEAGVGHRRARVPSYEHPGTGASGTLDVAGPMYMLGLGAQWFVSPVVAVDMGFRVAGGDFTSVHFEDVNVTDELTFEATSGRAFFGIAWYPMSQRLRRR